MTKIAGSGSICQRHEAADPDLDPDPHQNVMDPQQCRTDIRKYSFAVRTVEHWNNLQERARAANSQQAFKAVLKNIKM